MSSLRARFDGKVFVPVTAVDLLPGTEVEVSVPEKTSPLGTKEDGLALPTDGLQRKRRAGMAKGAVLWMAPDFADPVDDFED